jgi:hypothetical protein
MPIKPTKHRRSEVAFVCVVAIALAASGCFRHSYAAAVPMPTIAPVCPFAMIGGARPFDMADIEERFGAEVFNVHACDRHRFPMEAREPSGAIADEAPGSQNSDEFRNSL